MTTPEFVSPRDALDIVFANRNKAYGAYQLRREYPVQLGRALGLGLLLIGFFLALPHLLKAWSANFPADETSTEYVVHEVIIEIPPPVVSPPPVVTPPPPTRAMERFVPPIVRIDETVQEKEQQKAIDEILSSNTDVGAKDNVGDKDAPPEDPKVDFGDGAIVQTQAAPEKEYELYSLQKAPSFPGGEQEMLRYLSKNIQYPGMAKENGIKGTVVLQFIVGIDGSIGEVAIVKDIGGGCGKEAMRVVKAMQPWSPGEANGHPVKVRFTLPVRFELQ